MSGWKYWLRPQLDFFVDIGFLKVSTQVLAYQYAIDCRTYLGLSVRLFKWRATFRWYETALSILMREKLNK
jgi:hypothetical protein